MRADLPIRCACGRVRGCARDIHPGAANRVVCHCRGCRAYAAHIDREAQILDPHGGSDVFQISPAALSFEAGIEHIRCLRMTPKGALRWYAGCCDTPIAGSFHTRRVPFLSIYPACVEAEALDGPLDAYRGPVLARVNGTFDRAEAKTLKANPGALLAMLPRYAWWCLKWMASGAYKRTPLFERETAAPIAEPLVIGIADA